MGALGRPSQPGERERVVEIALTWKGTKYHDHAKVKGAGVDCGQLIGAVFEEAGQIEDFATGYYSPQWYLHKDEDVFIKYILQYAREIAFEETQIADLVVYKVGRLFAHGAIIVSPGWPRIVHAYKPTMSVVENDGSIGPLGARERRFFSHW